MNFAKVSSEKDREKVNIDLNRHYAGKEQVSKQVMAIS